MSTMILTVIGGGSVNWMSGLMRDVYLLDEVEGGEIRLVDPNKEHVEAVASMLETFNKIKNKSYKISIIEDQCEALKGANFVMTTFSPGAMDAFYNDLEIPIKYGIRQPVSMTVGPCGISAALRTVSAVYELVENMEKYCPGAWLLNVTNPMSVVINAMYKAAKTVKIIGMCHEFHAFPSLMGPILGLEKPEGMGVVEYLYKWLPAQGFDYTVAGLNHFIWLTKANLNGKDMIPVIREYAENHWQIGEDDGDTNPFHNKCAAKLAMCRQFGYLPLAGDRHQIEFYPSLCNPMNGYGMKYGVSKTTVDYRRHMKAQQLQDIRDIAAGKKEVSWVTEGEEMTENMRAIINGTSNVTIVNMPNQGQISNMHMGAIVETLATVTKDGITPHMSGDLPGSVGTLCRLHADIHELTVQAALQGDRRLVVEALSLDPSSGCADFSELTKLADELINANKQWLPRFFK